jgi:hypothetical protein
MPLTTFVRLRDIRPGGRFRLMPEGTPQVVIDHSNAFPDVWTSYRAEDSTVVHVLPSSKTVILVPSPL